MENLGFCKSCSKKGNYRDNVCDPCFAENEQAKDDYEIKPYVYPELGQEEIITRRRELCSELEEVTAQLSGQLIESAEECARLRTALSQIVIAHDLLLQSNSVSVGHYWLNHRFNRVVDDARKALQGKGE